MKILFNTITFKSYTKTYYKGDNIITEYFDDNNHLTKIMEIDKFKRDVDTKEFGQRGETTFHLHKEYDGNKIIETCKDRIQEYTRIINTFKKGEYTHRTEEYISKYSPEKNYIHEFIRDSANRLIRVICNGKIIDLAKHT